jgi:apolipoprotein N-acyltransferase
LNKAFARLRALRGHQANLAAAVLGALSALALPPLYGLPVLLIAIPGLIALIDGAASWRGALLRGFWFGFAHHVCGLYWITSAILIEAAQFWWFVPFAVPGTALILAPFIAVAVAIAKLAPPGWRRTLLLAAAWVLGDLAREFVATGFPWNPLGSALEFPGSIGSLLIAPAALIGVPGLTFFTVWFAATPGQSRRFALTALAGLAIWITAGAWLLHQPLGASPGFSAVLVQGNVPERDKQLEDPAIAGFQRTLNLTHAGVAAAGAQKTIVIWSETGGWPYLIEQDAGARAQIAEAGAGAAGFLIGTVRYGSIDPNARPYNSLLALSPSGETLAHYDKWHLVPFGEYDPSVGVLGLKISPGSGFIPGPGPRTLHVPGIPPVGVMICYEAVFPGRVVDPHDRPVWLVNVTNDAWFGNSSGPRQHLAAVRMRAVEEGLPVMRTANTGISAGFDAHGRELGRLGMNQPGYLVLPLTGPLPPTIFSRFGLWIPFLLCLFAAALARTKVPPYRHRRGLTRQVLSQ